MSRQNWSKKSGAHKAKMSPKQHCIGCFAARHKIFPCEHYVHPLHNADAVSSRKITDDTVLDFLGKG